MLEKDDQQTHYQELSEVDKDSVETFWVAGPKGDAWKQMDAVMPARSALPDQRKADLDTMFSFHLHTGVPDEQVLSVVEPWHPLEIPGRLYIRHIETAQTGVFALVFFNGSRFTARDGTVTDTWNEKLIQAYERMFQEPEIPIYP